MTSPPSPGVIYPALDLLQEQALIWIEEEDGGRKRITITAEGIAWLAGHQEHFSHIQQKLNARMAGYKLRQNPQMKRALENFKAVLGLKVNQEPLSEAQLKQITGIIDRAALESSQLD
jgi:DNA-binding PadR family transcriptional regulator